MDMLASLNGEFHINKASNFTWSFTIMYGAFHELVNLAKENPYPILIEVDFSLLRSNTRKVKNRFDNHWYFLFNVFSIYYYLKNNQLMSSTV
jgi:hypothetical protein